MCVHLAFQRFFPITAICILFNFRNVKFVVQLCPLTALFIAFATSKLFTGINLRDL